VLGRSVTRRMPGLALAVAIASALLATLVPAVSAAGGLQVSTPYPAVAVAPGSKVSFDLTVQSSQDADISLALGTLPAGWTASLIGGGFVVDGLSVTAAKPGTVRLDVSVPGDAPAATQSIKVTATGGGATDVLTVAIRVNAAAAGDISMTTSTPALTGSSDADFSFDLQFKNDTAQDVTVSTSATGAAGWDVKAKIAGETQAASTVVTAGSSKGIQVTAKAPSGAPAGSYPIKVTATAGDRTATTDLQVDITGSYSLALTTPNDVLSASGSAGSPTTQQFSLVNNGTAPITSLKLTATPPTGWTVTFDPAAGLAALAPGKTGVINAVITPSSDAVAGDYVVSFASSADQAAVSQTAQIRFTVETSPLWAIIGLGIIVLILAGLFYVFRTYGRR